MAVPESKVETIESAVLVEPVSTYETDGKSPGAEIVPSDQNSIGGISTNPTNGSENAGVEEEKSKRVERRQETTGKRTRIEDKVQDPNDPDFAFPKAKREFKKNIKSDPTTLEASNDPVEIRKQVEFYFSDSNLPTDWHLVKKVGFSQNRPVPIADIHSFSRMRRFQPFESVVAALKDSEFLEVVEEDKVRRKNPLSPDVWQGTMRDSQRFFEDKTLDRSIYAKGFGEEQPTTQFDIEAFFAGYGHTNAVRLRRAHNKVFKGSVFVEFADEETQKKFMAIEVKPKWKDTELLWKSKRDYVQEKAADFAARKKSKPHADDWKSRRDYDQRNGHRGRGGFGRGRGQGYRGDRGSRGGRDRNSHGRPVHEHDPKVPRIRTSKPTDPDAPESRARASLESKISPPTQEQSSENKKRTREGDEKMEGEAKPAKVAKTEA